jgi:hypothetical protein
MMTKDLPWRSSHRIRLHHFANNRSMEPISYMVPDLGQHAEPYKEESGEDGDESKELDWNPRSFARPTDAQLHFEKEEVMTKIATNFFFDIKLAGDPIQCSEEDGTCDDME